MKFKTILIFALAILSTAILAYNKGYNDYRIKAMAINLSAGYSALLDIDKREYGLARAGILAKMGGELETYRRLSENPILVNLKKRDNNLEARIDRIEDYYRNSRN